MVRKIIQFLMWSGIRGNLIVGLLCMAIAPVPIFYVSDIEGKKQEIFQLEQDIKTIENQLDDLDLQKQELSPSDENFNQIQDEIDEISELKKKINSSVESNEEYLKKKPFSDSEFILLTAKSTGFVFALFGILLFFSGFFRGIAFIASIPFKIASEGIESERKKVCLEKSYTKENRAKPVWDKAQLILEKYYDRNLSQVNQIFVLSVVVMTAGFILISASILTPVLIPSFPVSQTLENLSDDRISAREDDELDSQSNESVNPSIPKERVRKTQSDARSQLVYLAGIAGIITEFIGATFMIIYRSTINQAIRYTESLERVNSVGMAIQILDSTSARSDIDSEESEEKQKILTNAKIEIAKLLIDKTSQIGDRNNNL